METNTEQTALTESAETKAMTETKTDVETVKPKKPFHIRKKKQKSGKHGKKKWIFLVLCLVAAAAAVFYFRGKNSKKNTAETNYTKVAVSKQSISETLSDSGTLEPADSYTVTSLVSGEILSANFEEGDLVKKGTLLYSIDSSSAANSVTSAELNYKQAVAAKYPAATISGTVSETNVKNGDSVKSGDALCTIVSSNDLIIDFMFTYTSLSDFYVGQPATIYISTFAGTVSGTVVAVSNSYTVTSTGVKVATVEVKAKNPGLVTSGNTATAVINGNSSYGNASISLGSSSTVYATGSGTVKNWSLLPGDSVKAGGTLCTISSDGVDNQITTAKLNLESAQNNVDNYKITSPIAGTVIEKDAKVGDKLESGASSNTTLAIIYDLTYLKMDLAVDELDISKVKVGQSVTITADAVDGTFTGTVEKVSIAGTTSNGVTTYPVTIKITDYGDLMPGMNVDASIVVAKSDNALVIPNAAVNRGNTVLITADSPSASNALKDKKAPDGYVYVKVETGVSNDNDIAITSGLQEGDTVAYVKQTASSSSTSTDSMFGGGGGDGGQQPSDGGDMGGGPSGGGASEGGGGYSRSSSTRTSNSKTSGGGGVG